MRTTITLDPEAESRIRDVMSERGLTFTQAINAAILENAPSRGDENTSTPTFAMGRERVDLDRALTLADALADDDLVRRSDHGT